MRPVELETVSRPFLQFSLSLTRQIDSLRDDRLITDFMPRLRARPNSPSPKTPSTTTIPTLERHENHRARDSRRTERSIWYLNKRMYTHGTVIGRGRGKTVWIYKSNQCLPFSMNRADFTRGVYTTLQRLRSTGASPRYR